MSLELHHDFTFNPDGSGRVHVRWSGPGGPGAPAPDAFVRSELEHARGVDAWADLRCEPAGDRLVFEAVAWFRDPAQLRFHCQGFHVSLLDFVVEPLADGGVCIATRQETPPARTPAVTGDPAARLAEERAKLAMAQGFLADLFGGLTCTAILRAPGPLRGPVSGERLDARSVRVQVEGRQLIDAIERLQRDDALLLRLLQQGEVTPTAVLAEFGVQGPVRLCTGPDIAPQFDYEQEVAAAQASFAVVAESLRAALPSVPLANARIVASRVVWEADAEREFAPQGQGRPGVELTVAGDLDHAVLSLDDAEYDALCAADGTDLLPAEAWDRRCHFPKSTRDGRTVLLDFALPLPGGGGFARFAGHVSCLVGSGTEDVDLALPELVEGAGSDVFGARLLRVTAEDDGATVFELALAVARQRVLDAVVRGTDGDLPLERIGYSSCNDTCELTFRAAGPLPPDGRLVLTCAAELQRVTYGFLLQDLDLLGRPIARG
ncbi:MAG: hypothetical protein JNL08_03795 [Planctomycetes bacterium]|nr:hypothetical protein [Planctomycetota bacterium]